MRDLFPYTALIERDVVRIETDEVAPIRQLRTSPDLRDAYVLKYAGADTTRNFGSRGVYVPGQLTDDDLDALLASIEREYDEGGTGSCKPLSVHRSPSNTWGRTAQSKTTTCPPSSVRSTGPTDCTVSCCWQHRRPT